MYFVNKNCNFFTFVPCKMFTIHILCTQSKYNNFFINSQSHFIEVLNLQCGIVSSTFIGTFFWMYYFFTPMTPVICNLDILPSVDLLQTTKNLDIQCTIHWVCCLRCFMALSFFHPQRLIFVDMYCNIWEIMQQMFMGCHHT
jgi:hypothetical protein